MRLKQASPGEGDRGEYEHWTNWSVEGGKTHEAYIAGPCQWFVVHPSERTKPCLWWMTDKALPCKLCGKQKLSCTVGYLPLWRAVDWRPKFVIIYDQEREHVENLPLHCRVKIGRESDRGAAIYVRLLTNQEPKFSTTLARRRQPQDITPSLLMLWDIPELNVWCAARPKVSDNAVSLTEGNPAGKVVAHAPQPYTPPDPLDVSSDYVEVVNRLKSRGANLPPSKNGKKE